jgi:glutathione synthase/RimK-type ligase-like ATP-grasp enzyme
MKVAILRNEDPDSGKKWELACQKANITYDTIDLSAHNWLELLQKESYDFLLLRPSGSVSHYKNMYDERIYILCKTLKYKTFPSYEECYIYENKKLLSYYLDATKIPHPKTNIFYNKQEALSFLNGVSFPIVSKTSTGASGSGVQVIRKAEDAQKYINKAFSKKGIRRQFGPNRVTGSPKKWLQKALQSPKYLKIKLKKYFFVYNHPERDYVIFQEFIPHEFEWRAVKIGESYFAHKKVKYGDKASGSKGIDYVAPPESLLNFIHELCVKHNFNFMAIDIFEDGKGGYLVNELQTIFGHVQEYILAIEGVSGRYLYKNSQWIFEPGDFNTNESFDLRLETAINLYKSHH